MRPDTLTTGLGVRSPRGTKLPTRSDSWSGEAGSSDRRRTTNNYRGSDKYGSVRTSGHGPTGVREEPDGGDEQPWVSDIPPTVVPLRSVTFVRESSDTIPSPGRVHGLSRLYGLKCRRLPSDVYVDPRGWGGRPRPEGEQGPRVTETCRTSGPTWRNVGPHPRGPGSTRGETDEEIRVDVTRRM